MNARLFNDVTNSHVAYKKNKHNKNMFFYWVYCFTRFIKRHWIAVFK